MSGGLSRLPSTVSRYLDEVVDASAGLADLGAPSTAETPADLHERLLVTRAAMTRVSEITGSLTLLSGRVKAALVEARGELDDEESSIVTRRPKVSFTEDYSSAKEKNARIGAATLETRRKVRQTEKVAVDLDAALAYARDRHRELDRAVRDIDTRLRLLSFEPNRA